MDAPERIWATEDAANFGEDKFHTTRPMSGLTEYIRADLCADPALLAEAVEVLRTLLIAADAESYADYCNAIESGHAFLDNLENHHDR
jgi:hypothetical protein